MQLIQFRLTFSGKDRHEQGEHLAVCEEGRCFKQNGRGDKRKSLVLPEGGKINMCQNKNKRYLVLCQQMGLKKNRNTSTHCFSICYIQVSPRKLNLKYIWAGVIGRFAFTLLRQFGVSISGYKPTHKRGTVCAKGFKKNQNYYNVQEYILDITKFGRADNVS